MKKWLIIILSFSVLIQCTKKEKEYGIWIFLDYQPYIKLNLKGVKSDAKIPQGKKIIRNGIRIVNILKNYGVNEGKWILFYGKGKRLKLDWSSVEHPLYKVSLVKEFNNTYTLAGTYGLLKNPRNWLKEITAINVISGIMRKNVETQSPYLRIFFKNKLVKEIFPEDIKEEKNLEEFLQELVREPYSSVSIKGAGRKIDIKKDEISKYSITVTPSGKIKVFRKGLKRGKRRYRIKEVKEIRLE